MIPIEVEIFPFKNFSKSFQKLIKDNISLPTIIVVVNNSHKVVINNFNKSTNNIKLIRIKLMYLITSSKTQIHPPIKFKINVEIHNNLIKT